MSIDAFFPPASYPAGLKCHTHFTGLSMGPFIKRGSSLCDATIAGTDSLTNYNIQTSVQGFYGNHATAVIQNYIENTALISGAAIGDDVTAAISGHITTTFSDSILTPNIAGAKDLKFTQLTRASAVGGSSILPQCYFTVMCQGAANRYEVEEYYVSFRFQLPDLNSILTIPADGGHFWAFFDYKHDGYNGTGAGDYRLISQVIKGADGNLYWNTRGDNQANSGGAIPSVGSGLVKYWESNVTTGVDLETPLLFECYVRRPQKIWTRSSTVEAGAVGPKYEKDLVTGITKVGITNLSTGVFTMLANQIGGEQMGNENLVLGRAFHGFYSPTANNVAYLSDWQVWDRVPAHSRLSKRYTYYLAKFYAPLRGSLALTKGTGSVTFTRATACWEFNHLGKLVSIPSGAVRMRGYRPVVNSVAYSEGTYNVHTRASSSPGNTDVPAGKNCTTSTKLVEDSTAASTHFGARTISVQMTGTYKIWQYFKAAGRTSIGIYGSGAPSFPFPSGSSAVVDLSTGAVTGTASAHVSATLLDDGWVEVISTHVPTATGNHLLYTELRSGGSATYTGDGTSGVLNTGVMAVNITPNALTTIPEYVSVGVLSSPWHGAGADGVKYFSTYEDGTPIPEANLLGAGLNPVAVTNNLLWCRDLLAGAVAGKWIPSVAGSNLVTNGTFDTDASGWGTFNCSLSVTSGQCTLTASGDNPYMSRAMATVIGKLYVVSCDVITDSMTGNNFIKVGSSVGSGNVGSLVTVVGTNKFSFVATGTTTYITVSGGAGVSGQTIVVDNITCYESAVLIALNQTGIDNQAASSSLLTAAADNATISQTITAAAAAACSGFYVKRSAGTGSIYFTRDGGSSWTDITNSINSSTFALVKIENTSVLNPQVGFKIAASGDAIIVDAGINHLGTKIASCPILTTSASVTVNAETLTYPTTYNIETSQGTILATFTADSYSSGMGNIVGSSTAGLATSSSYTCQAKDGTNTVNGSAASPSGTIKIGMAWNASLSTMQAIGENGIETSGTYDGSLGLSTIAILPSVDGYIKDVACFNIVLSSSEVQSVFNS